MPFAHYDPIPDPDDGFTLFAVDVQRLQPTQMCVGLAEVRSRQRDFLNDSPAERERYLRKKPVPLVRNRQGDLWIIDRHHRLRALLEIDPTVTTFGYIIEDINVDDRHSVLQHLQQRGWLYLFDGRGQGPHAPEALSSNLMGLQDDPYRSLVWKLKKERAIKPQPLIPYHEFRWGAWLRSRPLPPFSSAQLEPALPAARRLVRSAGAAHLAGWTGNS
ncbi:MAG: ParB-like protein [Synechococcus sp.]